MPDLPDPVEILDEIDAAIEQVDIAVKQIDAQVKTVEVKTTSINRKFAFNIPLKRTPKQPITKSQDVLLTKGEEKPETGRTFEGQSDEAYCLECVEGHTMTALTEMRHAIDRYRTAGKMTDGVTEKVRVAIAELQGITEDVRTTEKASPDVKKGLGAILDEVRWVRKEFGISGGLTRGIGSMEDLEELRERISTMNLTAYKLVEKCTTCKPVKGYHVREKE